MENQENLPLPQANAATTDDVTALNEIVAERRKAQGISDPAVAAVKFQMATLPPLTPAQNERIERERQEIEAAEQVRLRRERLADYLNSIGELHSSCRLHNFEAKTERQKQILQLCHDYSVSISERLERREGLVFYGPVGTGKDHLACAIGGVAVEKFDRRVELCNVQDWFGKVRDAMDNDESEKSLLRALSWQDVLILSDVLPPLASTGLSQHMATMLYRLIETRDCRGKTTWATVNVKDDAEADERMGAPVWDRLCDRAWKVRFDGASKRKPVRTID